MNDDITYMTTGMKAFTLEELSADYEEMGVKLRKQVSKKVLRRSGAWASIAFVFQKFNTTSGEWEAPQVMLATFKNSGGMYVRQSYYIIKNKREAETIWEFVKEF